MNEDCMNQLKEEIHSKCIAYEYCDPEDHSVSDFIASLVQIGKTEEEVNFELQQLVGSDYESNLTQWVFSRKAELESGKATSQNNEPPRKENRIFAQALGDAIGNGRSRHRRSPSRSRSRSRSRSPARRETRISHREENVFSRLGQSKKEDRPSVFDRLGKTPIPIPSEASMEEEKPKQRCIYWPTCKNGDDCPYFHPNTICRDFPNCPNASNECMFIHPETAKPMAPQPLPQPTKYPIPCRYFPYCSNPVCPYIHPVQNPYFMQAQPSYHKTQPPQQQRMPVPCKNGDDCTRPGCHFLHPKDPNPFADVICKFDGACTRPNCLYKHTQENAQHKTLTLNNRTFSHPEEEVEHMVVGPSADIIKESKPAAEETEEDEFKEIGDVVVDTA